MKTQINEQTQWQTQNANNIQVRIVARKKRILDDDVVITQDNIQRIGEIIAVATIKTIMCRSGKNLYWLYDGLIKDCKRANDVNHTYSAGYDIAQTAMLFLCEHIGKQLGDNFTTARGKIVTVKQACFRFVDRYLDRQYTRHLMHTTAIDEAATASTITFIDEEPNNDYTAVDTIIEAMRLTPTEYETLTAYMSGLSNIEIARLLNVNHTTIWRRRERIIVKYSNCMQKTF
ncbi:MAG: helix-turn-helix transcriptional regulator [Paludibacteraceae bacterium]